MNRRQAAQLLGIHGAASSLKTNRARLPAEGTIARFPRARLMVVALPEVSAAKLDEYSKRRHC